MTDKRRSYEQHKRFFGLVKALFDHWPESQQFSPDNEEHLRAFLLVKSGHRVIKSFEVGDGSDAARMVPIIILMMTQKYAWAWPIEGGIKVCMADSIAFDKMPHKQACEIFDRVDAYVRDVIGIEPDELLRETEKAA